MNLYLRYFNTEVVVDDVNKALDFLSSIPEIDVDEFLAKDLVQYQKSDIPYPKRVKVRGKNYFIVIKTKANTLQEFKELGAQPRANVDPNAPTEKELLEARLTEYMPGWYDASILFKRMVEMPYDGKCQTIDTNFRVRVKATCIQDCYDRVCDHLRNRYDVDRRSQFPSVKGRGFSCQYLGMK